jgi:hypothetical protein
VEQKAYRKQKNVVIGNRKRVIFFLAKIELDTLSETLLLGKAYFYYAIKCVLVIAYPEEGARKIGNLHANEPKCNGSVERLPSPYCLSISHFEVPPSTYNGADKVVRNFIHVIAVKNIQRKNLIWIN